MADPSLVVRRLSSSRREDFLKFFDDIAFTDNKNWASCYCQCYYEDHRVIRWHDLTAERNRARASERIDVGDMQGCLAYLGPDVVGWCSAAPRQLVHALDTEPIEDAAQSGAVTCFLIAPTQRGRGIARALLAEAEAMLREQGLSWVDAYPRQNDVTASGNHYGPLALFIGAGYRVVKEDPSDHSVWVRKAL